MKDGRNAPGIEFLENGPALLDHVEDGGIVVQPQVVVGYGHSLEGDLLGVLEEGVRPPDAMEPLDGEETVLAAHVGGKNQPVVLPVLGEENVRSISLEEEKHKGANAQGLTNSKQYISNFTIDPSSMVSKLITVTWNCTIVALPERSGGLWSLESPTQKGEPFARILSFFLSSGKNFLSFLPHLLVWADAFCRRSPCRRCPQTPKACHLGTFYAREKKEREKGWEKFLSRSLRSGTTCQNLTCRFPPAPR